MQSRDPFSCFIIGEGTLPLRCAELLFDRGLKINGIISSDAAIQRWAQEKETPHIDPRDDVTAFVKRQVPDRIAVKTPTHTFTYAALNGLADRIAWAILQQRGRGQEPVALLFDHDAP